MLSHNRFIHIDSEADFDKAEEAMSNYHPMFAATSAYWRVKMIGHQNIGNDFRIHYVIRLIHRQTVEVSIKRVFHGPIPHHFQGSLKFVYDCVDNIFIETSIFRELFQIPERLRLCALWQKEEEPKNVVAKLPLDLVKMIGSYV